MSIQTRRSFLQTSAFVVGGTAALSCVPRLHALPLGLPLGLQLYSVRDLLPKDYAGTLKQIAALGYREVEAAGFYDHPAAEVKQVMADAGLHCVSGHYSWPALAGSVEKTIAYHQALGAQYIICSFPGYKNPDRLKGQSHAAQVLGFTMDDWRWNAEQFNKVGKTIKDAGLSFGYHNHTMEFTKQDGLVPFDELIRLTDPALVTIEMDCGWVSVGGGDPAAYLKKYPERISMLHVKDFKRTATPMSVVEPPPAAELGRGTVDFKAIFAAASREHVKHAFVEQEHFNIEPFAALKIDAEYMQGLK